MRSREEDVGACKAPLQLNAVPLLFHRAIVVDHALFEENDLGHALFEENDLGHALFEENDLGHALFEQNDRALTKRPDNEPHESRIADVPY